MKMADVNVGVDAETKEVKRLAKTLYVSGIVITGINNALFALVYSWLIVADTGRWLAVCLLASIGGIMSTLAVTPGNVKRFFAPIGKSNQFINHIAAGDLTASLKNEDFGPLDVLRVSLEQMGREIRRLVGEVVKGTKTIDSSARILTEEADRTAMIAREVADAIAQVAKGAGEQAAAVQKVTVETEKAAQLVNDIGESTSRARGLLEASRQVTRSGYAALTEQKARADENRQVIEQMKAAIEELAEKTNQIKLIMQTITSIAEQTGLLALNASIEAARASDAGKGFEVVAQEVRKLADQSSTAGSQIEGLTTGIITTIDQIVGETKLAAEAVYEQAMSIEMTTDVIDQTGTNLDQFLAGLEHVEQQIAQILNLTNNLNMAVASISSVTEQTSAGAEQVAASAIQQADAMAQLQEFSEVFKTGVGRLNAQSSRFTLPADIENELAQSQEIIPADTEVLQTIAKQYTKRTIVISSIMGAGIFGPLLGWFGHEWNTAGILVGMLFGGGSAVMLGGLSTSRNRKKSVYPVAIFMHRAEAVARGDLTLDIGREENVGTLQSVRDAFNQMLENLRGMANEIRETSGTVNQTAMKAAQITAETSEAGEQIFTTVREIAQGAQNQASELTEILPSVDILANAAGEILTGTRNIAASAEATEKRIEEGIQSTAFQMRKVNEHMELVNKVDARIRELEDKSQVIGQIVKTITDIASQTNLLALNAAIEAARAGEQGRGFAVVAEEVRKLAERSSEAAGGIYGLIEEIREGTGKVVSSMELTREALTTQTEAASRGKRSLEEMSGGIRPVHEEAKQMAGISDTINQAAERILREMEGIASASEQTAAAAEEVAASTEQQQLSLEKVGWLMQEFAQLSKGLNERAARFKVGA